MTETLTQAARVLVQFDGQGISASRVSMRKALVAATGQPFLPDDAEYPVWRNYARIFEAAQLATKIDECLRVTDVCRKLAVPGDMSADDYLLHVTRTCIMPNPAFDDYDGTVRTYPATAVIRLLMAAPRYQQDGLSSKDVVAVLAGNEIVGTESVTTFAALRPTRCTPIGDEDRQVREFLRFLSQLSFLHFEKGCLWYLGPAMGSPDWTALWEAVAPRATTLTDDASEGVLALGSLDGRPPLTLPIVTSDPVEQKFIEGSRVQRTHVAVERNPALRRQFLRKSTRPIECDVCEMIPDEKYPWTRDMVELHHLLPLTSSVRVEGAHTSLKDLVPVCPSCHRAVHIFYVGWLRDEGRRDFASKSEAVSVYEAAKSRVA
jgi:hypothetical protein